MIFYFKRLEGKEAKNYEIKILKCWPEINRQLKKISSYFLMFFMENNCLFTRLFYGKFCKIVLLLIVVYCVLLHSRFVDSETMRVKDILEEMENFSPIGSSILNRSGVSCHSRTIISH